MTNPIRQKATIWAALLMLAIGLFTQQVQASDRDANAVIMKLYALEKAQDYARAARLFPANAKISIVWNFGAFYPKERATVTPREWIKIMREADAELAQYEKGFRETGREARIISSKTVGDTVQIQSSLIVHFTYDGKAGVITQKDRFSVRKSGNIFQVIDWKSNQDLSDLL